MILQRSFYKSACCIQRSLFPLEQILRHLGEVVVASCVCFCIKQQMSRERNSKMVEISQHAV